MIKQVLLLLALFVMQVLVINNLGISTYINPYIYPLIILSLPLKTTRIMLLLYAFGVGLLMDLFCNTAGMHAAALLVMAYMRPFVFRSLSPRSNINADEMLHVKSIGLSSFFYYTLILIFLHHFIYFFLEIFSFSHFFKTMLKVVLSTVFSSLLILISAVLIAPNKSRS